MNSLSDELLAKICAAAGSRAAAAAAATCTRLRQLVASLRCQPCFGSAMVLGDNLAADLTAAVRRAQDSMVAPTQFAVCFFANYETPRKGQPAPAQAAADLLRALLPAGAQAVGCTARGLFGTLADGSAAELDVAAAGTPSARRRTQRQRGVSVLLGNLPDCRAAAFQDRLGSHKALCEALGELSGLQHAPHYLFLLTAPRLVTEAVQLQLLSAGLEHPSLVISGGVASRDLFCCGVDGEGAGSAGGLRQVGLLISKPRALPPQQAQQAQQEAQQQQQQQGEEEEMAEVQQAAGAGAHPPVARQPVAATLAVEGMVGVGPVAAEIKLHHIGFHGDGDDGAPAEHHILCVGGAVSAADGDSDVVPALTQQMDEQTGPHEFAIWQAPRAEMAQQSYQAAVTAGLDVIRLGVVGAEEDGNPIALAGRHLLLANRGVAPSQALARLAQRQKESMEANTICGQLLRFASPGVLSELQRRLPDLAALRLPRDPLLPAVANSALLVVACSAKGAHLHKVLGREAQQISRGFPGANGLPALAGAFLDGEIGPHVVNGASALHTAAEPGSQQEQQWSCVQPYTTMLSLLSG